MVTCVDTADEECNASLELVDGRTAVVEVFSVFADGAVELTCELEDGSVDLVTE